MEEEAGARSGQEPRCQGPCCGFANSRYEQRRMQLDSAAVRNPGLIWTAGISPSAARRPAARVPRRPAAVRGQGSWPSAGQRFPPGPESFWPASRRRPPARTRCCPAAPTVRGSARGRALSRYRGRPQLGQSPAVSVRRSALRVTVAVHRPSGRWRVCLVGFPGLVGVGHADRARSVTGLGGRCGVGEEDPMVDVPAPGDGSQGGGAVKAPEDLGAPVGADCPLLGAGMGLAAGPAERVRLGRPRGGAGRPGSGTRPHRNGADPW
jgi:hypothetical protein